MINQKDLETDPIVNIITQVFQNEHFKILLRDTVDEMCRRSRINSAKQQEYQSVSQTISEIVEYLSVYLNESIIKFNTEYSQSLIVKFQQMQIDQQKRFSRKIEDKISEIINEILEKMEKMSQYKAKTTPEKRINLVAEKRKTLTNTILNSSLLEEHKQNKIAKQLENSLSGFQGLLDQQFSLFATKRMEQLTMRISQIEQNMKDNQKETHKRQQKAQEVVQKINITMEMEIEMIRKNVHDQFQANLQGVWNVIAQLEKKIRNLSS